MGSLYLNLDLELDILRRPFSCLYFEQAFTLLGA